jgi:hypothetical protein
VSEYRSHLLRNGRCAKCGVNAGYVVPGKCVGREMWPAALAERLERAARTMICYLDYGPWPHGANDVEAALSAVDAARRAGEIPERRSQSNQEEVIDGDDQ